MKALLVHPLTPVTYWGFQHSLPMVGKAASLPPLGLASLAALLPASWSLRVVDLNVSPLADEELLGADAVLVTGMLIHHRSMREVLQRARALGRRTVVGGPAATTSPDAFPEADHVFQGEAEGRLDHLVRALESPDEPAPRLLSPAGEERPAMSQVPPPRFDLLEHRRYTSMSIQYSRGCPFQCEFCDIIEMFGRVPRVKSPDQVITELEALLATGYRGTLFFVDDNFIGNRRAVAELLPRLAAWQEAHGWPFELYTEASVDLAGRPDLAAAMVRAGFSAVFLGIESPSTDALQEARKLQNLKLAPLDAVEALARAGLEVFAGFIVGFDSDGPDIFDRQRDFILRSPVGMAMIGILNALPGTALARRLAREGRLRGGFEGDNLGLPTFETALGDEVLIRGYRALLSAVYDAEALYDRFERLLDLLGPGPRIAPRPGGLAALGRAMWTVGVRSPRRWRFWRLLARTLIRSPRRFARAVALAIQGEHLVRYTSEEMVPRLDRALALLEQRRGDAPAATPEPVRPRAPPLPPRDRRVASLRETTGRA